MKFIRIIRQLQELGVEGLGISKEFYQVEVDLTKGTNCVILDTGYTTVGRFYKKCYKDADPKVVSKLSEMFNSMVLNGESTKVKFSDTPSKIYDMSHRGFSSCMEGRGEELFDKLNEHEDSSIAYIEDEDGYLIARCLIWNGKIYDNIYAKSGYHEKLEIELHKKGFKPVWSNSVCIPFEYYDGEPVPYMDNVRNYCYKRKILFNNTYVDEQSGTNWEGDYGTDTLSFEYFDGIYCELTGENVHEEDAVWSDNQQSYLRYDDYNVVRTSDDDYIHTDYSHDYIDINGEYYPEDDCVQLRDGLIVLYDDCVELENGEYCLEEDAVECHIDGCIYHKDDCVELENGRIVNIENKKDEELQAEDQLIEA